MTEDPPSAEKRADLRARIRRGERIPDRFLRDRDIPDCLIEDAGVPEQLRRDTDDIPAELIEDATTEEPDS